jgi:hypothetical protein
MQGTVHRKSTGMRGRTRASTRRGHCIACDSRERRRAGHRQSARTAKRSRPPRRQRSARRTFLGTCYVCRLGGKALSTEDRFQGDRKAADTDARTAWDDGSVACIRACALRRTSHELGRTCGRRAGRGRISPSIRRSKPASGPCIEPFGSGHKPNQCPPSSNRGLRRAR